jgi:predicted ABC-type ATPase
VSRLDLVVGPNGAGKSTFVRFTLAPLRPGVPFVNADVIAAERWPDDQRAHAYEAAAIASRIREALIAQQQPLIAETVFSHPSKLDLIDRAHAAGYDIRLHVIMVPPDLSVARVTHRVQAGGHDVPEDKIRQRHDRLWGLVAQAAVRVPVASFYANHTGPTLVAVFHHGRPASATDWPTWTHPDLINGLTQD